MREIRAALRTPEHNDAAFNHEWDAEVETGGTLNAELAAAVIAELETLIARSTGSINNAYTKAQITSGICIGLIAGYAGVLGQLPGAKVPLLAMAVVMTAIALILQQIITTPSRGVWTQTVENPGIYAINLTPKAKARSLSRRALHTRAVLHHSRRLAWLATWALILPGLALSVASWAPLYSLIGFGAVVLVAVIFRSLLGSKRPMGAKVYPSM